MLCATIPVQQLQTAPQTILLLLTTTKLLLKHHQACKLDSSLFQSSPLHNICTGKAKQNFKLLSQNDKGEKKTLQGYT